MSRDLEILSSNDVISVLKHDEGRFVSGDTLKVKQLLEEYEEYIKVQTKTTNNSEIFIEGIECEVLSKDGNLKGWRKGKIKFVVQFEPEEAELNNNQNSLEDIRRQIDNTN
ncbi:MAG: KGK domain-containing protein [Patescibacteria group bacterium]